MGLAWLIVLCIYGFARGFDGLVALDWLLLIPMFMQDMMIGTFIQKLKIIEKHLNLSTDEDD